MGTLTNNTFLICLHVTMKGNPELNNLKVIPTVPFWLIRKEPNSEAFVKIMTAIHKGKG